MSTIANEITGSNVQKPEPVTLTGVLRKITHLDAEKVNVEKSLYLLKIDQKGQIATVAASPKYLENQYGAEYESELKKKLGTIVMLDCEHNVAGVTGYTDKDGKQVFHQTTGYTMREEYTVTEAEQREYHYTRLKGMNKSMSQEEITALMAV